MAFELPLFKPGVFVANSDLSLKEFLALKVVNAAPPALDLQTSAGGNIYGVLQNKPILAEAVEVIRHGITKAVAGAAFNPGVLLMVNASGKFVTATTGNYAVAIALEVASADGDIVAIDLQNIGKV